MSSERAGDRVFTNIDRALAEKIVARSKENSKTAAPAAAIEPELEYAQDGRDDRWRPARKPMPLLKVGAAILALAALIIIIFKRGEK